MHAYDLKAEAEYVETLRAEWLVERDKLHATLAECRTSRTTPGPNYWEAARRAEQRFLLAAKVLATLEGA
jgi:hypothetical protein